MAPGINERNRAISPNADVKVAKQLKNKQTSASSGPRNACALGLLAISFKRHHARRDKTHHCRKKSDSNNPTWLTNLVNIIYSLWNMLKCIHETVVPTKTQQRKLLVNIHFPRKQLWQIDLKSLCETLRQRQSPKANLVFFTVSKSIFAFRALFLACSNSALVSWKRLLTPSSLHEKHFQSCKHYRIFANKLNRTKHNTSTSYSSVRLLLFKRFHVWSLNSL